jgi:hypothetical protein
MLQYDNTHDSKCHENVYAGTKPTFCCFFFLTLGQRYMCALAHTDMAIANAINKLFISAIINRKSSS